jgi:hypothetical protein
VPIPGTTKLEHAMDNWGALDIMAVAAASERAGASKPQG